MNKILIFLTLSFVFTCIAAKANPCKGLKKFAHVAVKGSIKGKICYHTAAQGKAASGPCGSWCTLDVKVGGGCGSNKKRLCHKAKKSHKKHAKKHNKKHAKKHHKKAKKVVKKHAKKHVKKHVKKHHKKIGHRFKKGQAAGKKIPHKVFSAIKKLTKSGKNEVRSTKTGSIGSYNYLMVYITRSGHHTKVKHIKKAHKIAKKHVKKHAAKKGKKHHKKTKKHHKKAKKVVKHKKAKKVVKHKKHAKKGKNLCAKYGKWKYVATHGSAKNKICWTTKAAQKAGTSGCGGWCTLSLKVGSGCGNNKKNLCKVMAKKAKKHHKKHAKKGKNPCAKYGKWKWVANHGSLKGHLCWSSKAAQKAGTAGCGGWCTLNTKFGSGCGNNKKNLCRVMAKKAKKSKNPCAKYGKWKFAANRGNLKNQLCWSSKKYQKAGTAPCGGWCTLNTKFGSGCGNNKLRLCKVMAHKKRALSIANLEF